MLLPGGHDDRTAKFRKRAGQAGDGVRRPEGTVLVERIDDQQRVGARMLQELAEHWRAQSFEETAFVRLEVGEHRQRVENACHQGVGAALTEPRFEAACMHVDDPVGIEACCVKRRGGLAGAIYAC